MPIYSFRLENSSGPVGYSGKQRFEDDEGALKEAGTAAAEVLLSELNEGCSAPKATVMVERDDTVIALVKATATVERLA